MMPSSRCVDRSLLCVCVCVCVCVCLSFCANENNVSARAFARSNQTLSFFFSSQYMNPWNFKNENANGLERYQAALSAYNSHMA